MTESLMTTEGFNCIIQRDRSVKYMSYDGKIVGIWWPGTGTVYLEKGLFPNGKRRDSAKDRIQFEALLATASLESKQAGPKPTEGITSDVGMKGGNPGDCEYNVTEIDGQLIQHEFIEGTHSNNYGELWGIREACRIAVKRNETLLWTDSQVCQRWIATGKVPGSVLERDDIISMVHEIQHLVRDHSLRICKWDKTAWGEIPSDFSRK